MKTHRTPKLIRGLTAVVGGFALFTGGAHAAPFLYGPGDLVLAFRQTGNASDYVVNIGKAINYSTLPTGATLAVTNLSASQLTSAFPSVNGLAWSVAAAHRPPADTNFPLQTIWITAPRFDIATQSPAWLRKGQFIQGTAASQIDAVGVNAAAYSSSQPAGDNNTVTGVVIPASSDYAFTPLIGDAADYGSFQGNVENRTPDDFDSSASIVVRSDLYELLPGASAEGTLNAPGRYLGYFELKPDGTLTFNTGAPAITQPSITNVARNGSVTTVSFTTVSGATYRLRATDAAGLTSPVSTWSPGATVSGNGALQSLQDTSSDGLRFFAVEAQP